MRLKRNRMKFTVALFVILIALYATAAPFSGTISDFVGINTNAGAYDKRIVERLAKVAHEL